MAGDGEEHVVEVGRVHGEPLDLDAGVIEFGQKRAQRRDAPVAGHPEDELALVAGRAVENLGGERQAPPAVVNSSCT